MLPSSLALAQAGCAVALAVVTVRAFPVLVAFFAVPASGKDKLIAFLSHTAIAVLGAAYSDFEPRELALTMAVLVTASMVPYAITAGSPKHRAFWWIAGVLFVVPALTLHEHSLLLLIAWDLTLAAHSYLHHVHGRSRSLPGYLFFLFVNPSLAYPQRGARVAEPALHGMGLLRAAQGVALLAASGALQVLASRARVPEPDMTSRSLAAGLRLAGLCAGHFGLASLQIGLCRQLGYVIPERYRKPYLARSPRDFWARWNTYVGAWIRIHVFMPVARSLRSRWRGTSKVRRIAINAVALAASFGAVGALHDAYVMAITRRPTANMTLWFVLNAVILVGWDAAAIVLPRLTAPLARFAAPMAMLGLVAGLALALP